MISYFCIYTGHYKGIFWLGIISHIFILSVICRKDGLEIENICKNYDSIKEIVLSVTTEVIHISWNGTSEPFAKWVITAPAQKHITVRFSSIELSINASLSIFGKSKLNLMKFSKFHRKPHSGKIIFPFNEVHLIADACWLIPNQDSFFELEAEVRGICSGQSSRVPCGLRDPGFCYLGDRQTPNTSPHTDRCDGVFDCPLSGADEANCDFCPADFYPCESKSHTTSHIKSCYPALGRCDGHPHCLNRADELECIPEACQLRDQRFLCGASTYPGQCIGLAAVCNGLSECFNGADEDVQLCRRNESLPYPELAQLLAHSVVRTSLTVSISAATSRIEARLRTVLTLTLSALIGLIVSVIAVSFVCQSQSSQLQHRTHRSVRFNSPVQRLLREELRRRPPPPTYNEALNNSLFEEPLFVDAPTPVPQPSIGLSRLQRDSVRQRSLKPVFHINVACSCNLPDSEEATTVEPASEPTHRDTDQRSGRRLRRLFPFRRHGSSSRLQNLAEAPAGQPQRQLSTPNDPATDNRDSALLS